MRKTKLDYSKYIIDLPYPQRNIQSPNVEYANLLLKDYAGTTSELTAINLYAYQHFVCNGKCQDYAETVQSISIVEMRHLEQLAETIKSLGVDPIYYDNASPPGKFWDATNVNFTTNIKEMLIEDIKAEKTAIANYQKHIELIKDQNITDLLKRIILDEQLHVLQFSELYDKYK